MGGAAPPPTPPAFFCAMQAGFQENRTINKNCVKHVVVMAVFKVIIQAVCLQIVRMYSLFCIRCNCKCRSPFVKLEVRQKS